MCYVLLVMSHLFPEEYGVCVCVVEKSNKKEAPSGKGKVTKLTLSSADP